MTDAASRPSRAGPTGLAVYLGVVQFLLLATWILYAIYLPQLLASVGIEARWAGWILLADQALFACFDILAGFAADRAFRLYARIGYWVSAIGALSCLAFLSLPWLAAAGAPPPGFLAATLLWVISSSALRAPLFALLARHAALPAVPRLASWVLVGMGVAAALSPYLGALLTEVDPALPFAVSSLALLLVTGGLVAAERRAGPTAAVEPGPTPTGLSPGLPVAGFWVGLLLAAVAMQIAVFLNAGPRYLADLGKEWLPWLLPVFWVGFSMTVFTAGPLSARRGAVEVFAKACIVGGLALWLTRLPGILAGVGGYLVAGLAWGTALASAFGLAAVYGHAQRTATFNGILFAVLAGAAFLRIAINLAGWPQAPAWGPALAWAPGAGWLLGGLLVLGLARARAGL